MAYRFYVGLRNNKTPVIKVTWAACQRVRAQEGINFRGFNDFPSAQKWVAGQGGTLTEEAFPAFLLHCEPVLSVPKTVIHNKPMVTDKICVYTDGSCLQNPGGPSGFASVLLLPDGREIRLSGREPVSTSNRMELMAALAALDFINTHKLSRYNIHIHTDSRYLRNIFEDGWIYNWKANGWKTKTGRAVQNRDLLEILDWLVYSQSVRFIWVRSHGNNYFNNLADKLATEEARKIAEECGFPLESARSYVKPFIMKDNKQGLALTYPSVLVAPEGKPGKPKEKTSVMGEKPLDAKTSTRSSEHIVADKSKDATHKSEALPKASELLPTSTKEEGIMPTPCGEALEELPFIPCYRSISVTRQRKKGNRKLLSQKGNGIHKASVRMELRDGTYIIVPITERQAQFIGMALGLSARPGIGLQMFDELTLGRLIACKANPLPVLLEKHKDPFSGEER